MEANTLTAPVFEPITLGLRERIEKIRLASGNTVYTYTFPTLYAWRDIEKYSVAFGSGAFVAKNGLRGEDDYLFPCGSKSGKKELIDALLSAGKPRFNFARDEDKTFLEEEYPGKFEFEFTRDDCPYLYDRAAQIAMRGNLYKNLRHKVNQGRRFMEGCATEPLTGGNVSRAFEINKLWDKGRSDHDPADLIATEEALNAFDELGMWGLIFTVDGTDSAYVAGSFVNESIYDISFCKLTDKRCDCYVKWELYRALPDAVQTVDSEEDMGLEGLRDHKLMRCPKEITNIWRAAAI